VSVLDRRIADERAPPPRVAVYHTLLKQALGARLVLAQSLAHSHSPVTQSATSTEFSIGLLIANLAARRELVRVVVRAAHRSDCVW
jgi:hypothetical protein